MTKIPINPGGTLSPSQVLGREALINQLWGILKQQSLALLAPRRVGKSSICRLMASRPPDQIKIKLRDLEGLNHGGQFVATLFEDFGDLLSKTARAKGQAFKALEAITGLVDTKALLGVAIKPLDWAKVMDALFAELSEVAERDDLTIVAIWDEFTWFLADLIEKDRADHATTLLDRLRAVRQTYPRIRMIFTGSIGLRMVLERLEAQGYGNQPMNDVSKQSVPLFDQDSAQLVARALLPNIPHDIAQAEPLAARMAEVSEGHPLLLHSIAQKMKFAGHATMQAIDAALDKLLEEESDPLELSHFIKRLSSYLDASTCTAAYAVLDALAVEPDGLLMPALEQKLTADREILLQAIDVLRRTHYLVRTGKRLSFRLAFLRKYWAQERML